MSPKEVYRLFYPGMKIRVHDGTVVTLTTIYDGCIIFGMTPKRWVWNINGMPFDVEWTILSAPYYQPIIKDGSTYARAIHLFKTPEEVKVWCEKTGYKYLGVVRVDGIDYADIQKLLSPKGKYTPDPGIIKTKEHLK